MSVRAIVAMTHNIEREVTIQVKADDDSDNESQKGVETSAGPFRLECGVEGDSLPKHQVENVTSLFYSLEVPEIKLDMILKGVSKDLRTCLKDCYEAQEAFDKRMKTYPSKQMVGGQVGWGIESGHEKVSFLDAHKASIEHSNLSMVACNLVTKANALANPHGILVELIFKRKKLTKYPIGLKFISMANL